MFLINGRTVRPNEVPDGFTPEQWADELRYLIDVCRGFVGLETSCREQSGNIPLEIQLFMGKRALALGAWKKEIEGMFKNNMGRRIKEADVASLAERTKEEKKTRDSNSGYVSYPPMDDGVSCRSVVEGYVDNDRAIEIMVEEETAMNTCQVCGKSKSSRDGSCPGHKPKKGRSKNAIQDN